MIYFSGAGSLPILTDCDILTVSEDFYHMDRIADFNVTIYVTEGVMYVTEKGWDYEIDAGEMLLIKTGFAQVSIVFIC